MRFLALLLTLVPLHAAEIAVLRTGAVLRADRIERTADRVILDSVWPGRTELQPGDIDESVIEVVLGAAG